MLKIFQALVLLSFLTTFGCSRTKIPDSEQDSPTLSPVESSDTKTYEGTEVSTGGHCKVSIPENAEQLTNYGVIFHIYNEEGVIFISPQEGQITSQSEHNNTINFTSTSSPFIILQYDNIKKDFTYFEFSERTSPHNRRVFKCYFN